MKVVKTQRHRPDFILLTTSIILLLFGLLMVYNASPVTALRDFGDPFYLAKLQVAWAAAAVVAGVTMYKINYKILESLAPLIILGAVVLLLSVFIPGVGVKIYGAQRWISVAGIFSIQPAEFAKLAYVIYLASWLSKKIKLAPFAFITATVSLIVLLQRDLGTTVVISATGLIVYFLAEAPIVHFFTLIPIGVLTAAVFILGSEYRRARLLSFLNPTVDPQGATYHINQILIALGSGGILGVGLGQSKQKYGYIPEVTTDSIFAVVGEEFGFVGGALLVLLFTAFAWRGLWIANRAPDTFTSLMVVGIVVMIVSQSFINMAAMLNIIPLSGTALLFISKGGTTLLFALAEVGMILGVSRHIRK